MIQSSTLSKRIAAWIKELDPEPTPEPTPKEDYVHVHTTDEATYVRIKISGPTACSSMTSSPNSKTQTPRTACLKRSWPS
ncbi:hypothetical protein [Corynebacterium glutamicum]|uniref:hypothetical protein n=1 Tax=Corynebacterium glutamicum TaxID=1718 RepID=UPI0021BD6F1D|nr:hypothetical protein [Corynebacterium glutamicum]